MADISSDKTCFQGYSKITVRTTWDDLEGVTQKGRGSFLPLYHVYVIRMGHHILFENVTFKFNVVNNSLLLCVQTHAQSQIITILV